MIQLDEINRYREALKKIAALPCNIRQEESMTLAEAISAIVAGHKVRASNGGLFWLEHDKRGSVLMGEPVGYGKPIKHVVFSSEHFAPTLTWEILA